MMQTCLNVFDTYTADDQPEVQWDPAADLVRANRLAANARFATARTTWLDAKKRGHALEISEATTAMNRAWKQAARA